MADEPEVIKKVIPPKVTETVPKDPVYVVTEPGGFIFKGNNYQEHQRYALSKLKELGWHEDDIKAAHRMLKEAQDA
jgi:hypothetical protein